MEKPDMIPPATGAGKPAPPPVPVPPSVGAGAPPPVPMAAPAAPAVHSASAQHSSAAGTGAAPAAQHASASVVRLPGSLSRAPRSTGVSTAAAQSSAQDSRTPLPDGTRVGEYTITSKVGVGGFGIVYAAVRTQDGTPVAIKEHMPAGLAMREPGGTYVIHSSPENEERFKATVGEFLEEVTVLMGISHPGIVPIISAFQENGTAYYVMPFMQGSTLSVPEQTTLDIARQAQEARHVKRVLLSMLSIMDYLRMHRIVHRDIKPDNILVTESGETVLLDFGSARQLQPGKVFTNVFTPDFSAPEQSHSETDEEMSASLGPWTDLYSLGVCFYYLVTHLFPPRSELRLVSAVDPYTPLAGRVDLELLYGSAFLRAIDRALELKIRDRWQSAAAWRIAIGEGMMPTPPKKVRRIRTATIVTGASLALFAGITFWALRERAVALRASDNSRHFIERMLNDFNKEIADIPGSTRLQRMLGNHLNVYLNNMERPSGTSDEAYLRPQASSWRNYGAVCMQQGKLEEADSAYEHSEELLRRLRASYSGIISYPYDLADVLLSRVEVARSRNKVAQQKAFLKEAISILDELCYIAPQNPDFVCSKGQALGEAALLARAEGDRETYKKALADMLTLYRDVLRQSSDHIKAQEWLGYALQYNAQFAMDQEDFQAADALLDEARQVFSGLAARMPNRLSFKKGLSLTYYFLGSLYCRLSASAKDKDIKQYDDMALEAFRRHNDLVNYLETQDENKAEYPYMLCCALATMVDILLRNGQPNLAEAYCNTIARKTEQLLETAPDNVDYAVLSANAWRGLALAHSSSTLYAEETAKEFKQCCSIYERLLAQTPNITTLQYGYELALFDSAVYALTHGRVQQAREWLDRAESILLKLVQTDPDNALYTNELQRVREFVQQLETGAPDGTDEK